MLEIWGRRNSGNVIPVMWTVGELAIEYKRYNVGGSFGGLDSDQYGAANPNRKVPTICDRGRYLWESNAIVRYLGANYGGGSLLPGDAFDMALADQWMEWHKTTLYADYIGAFFALIRTEPADRNPEKINAHAGALGKVLKILEAQLDNRKFILGDMLSIADIPAGSAMYRYFEMDIARPSLPNVETWYRRLCARPAYQTHVMVPFGKTPAEWAALERDTGD